MSEYGETVAKFTVYVDSVIAELHEHEVEQVEGQLRALGWEKVVRCRDCKDFDPNENLCVLEDGDGGFEIFQVRPDGFCAWGERAEQ